MIELRYPFDERQVRALKAGDAVRITGPVHTGRDRFHQLYHCGPVIVRDGDGWAVKAAGPTTSVRENPYEPAFIAASGVRLIIGKGGMDAATLAAMGKYGCVYIQAVGGAAAVSAAALRKVTGVSYLKEFGAAEACWHFDAVGFTGVVAMDTHGRSLFAEVERASRARLAALLARDLV